MREIIPLHLIAAPCSEEIQLRFSFNTFSDYLQLETVSQRDDGHGNACVVGLGGDIANEGSIDLECIERKTLQIGQAGIAGPEIIHCQAYAVRTQCLENTYRLFRILH